MKVNSGQPIFITFLVFLFLLFSSCSKDKKEGSVRDQDPALPSDSLLTENSPAPPGSVRIGLLIRNRSSSDVSSLSARQGAELALSLLNQSGGYQGRPFHLIVRAVDGPWGVTASQVVNMIHEDSVLLIIGSLDGRNSHLAEQVVTKQHVVFISAWSSEQTLSQAFVPWFFRCVHDDRSQAAVLAGEIFENQKFRKVGLVVKDDYDTKMAATTFRRMAKKYNEPAVFSFHPLQHDLDHLAGQLKSSGLEAMVFFTGPAEAKKVIELVDDKRGEIFFYGHLSTFSDNTLLDLPAGIGPRFRVISPAIEKNPGGGEFIAHYKNRFGSFPDATAMYAFDALRIAAEAIKKAGLDKEAIRDSLSVMEFRDFLTGTFRFNERGNRTDSIFLREVLN